MVYYLSQARQSAGSTSAWAVGQTLARYAGSLSASMGFITYHITPNTGAENYAESIRILIVSVTKDVLHSASSCQHEVW